MAGAAPLPSLAWSPAKQVRSSSTIDANDPDAFVELAKKSRMLTLPQVFVGDVLLGGYQETAEADASGHLRELLAA